jgi:hypothetical protein
MDPPTIRFRDNFYPHFSEQRQLVCFRTHERPRLKKRDVVDWLTTQATLPVGSNWDDIRQVPELSVEGGKCQTFLLHGDAAPSDQINIITEMRLEDEEIAIAFIQNSLLAIEYAGDNPEEFIGTLAFACTFEKPTDRQKLYQRLVSLRQFVEKIEQVPEIGVSVNRLYGRKRILAFRTYSLYILLCLG